MIEGRVVPVETDLKELRQLVYDRAEIVDRALGDVRDAYASARGHLASVSQDVNAGARRLEAAIEELQALREDTGTRLRVQDSQLEKQDRKIDAIERRLWRGANGKH